MVDYFIAHRLDVAAGVKQQLEMDARRLSGLRLLPGRFMVINQAMGMRLGREAGAKYLTEFVEDMKASGFVAEALRRHAISAARNVTAANPAATASDAAGPGPPERAAPSGSSAWRTSATP